MRRQLSPPVHRRTRHMHNNATMSTAADTLRDTVEWNSCANPPSTPPALREAWPPCGWCRCAFHFTYADFLASPRHGQAARFS